MTKLFCLFFFLLFGAKNALVKEQQLYQIWKENVEDQKMKTKKVTGGCFLSRLSNGTGPGFRVIASKASLDRKTRGVETKQFLPSRELQPSDHIDWG